MEIYILKFLCSLYFQVSGVERDTVHGVCCAAPAVEHGRPPCCEFCRFKRRELLGIIKRRERLGSDGEAARSNYVDAPATVRRAEGLL